MLNLGVVQQDSTIYVPVPTRGADGGNVAPSGTITQADFTITYVTAASSTVLTLDASTITWSASLDSIDGKNRVSVDLSNDTDLQNAGGFYELWWESDATVDSITPVECLAVWTVETDSQKAARTLQSTAYITEILGTQTGVTDGTGLNLSAQIDAQTPDDALIGTVWLVQDATDGRSEEVVVTDYASSGTLATIATLGDGGALSFTPVAGDSAWRVGIVDRAYTASAAALATVDANVDTLVSPYITGTATLTPTVQTMSSDLTGYLDEELISRTIVWTSGTASGQAARIVDYLASNGTVVFTTIKTAPVSGDTFVIV